MTTAKTVLKKKALKRGEEDMLKIVLRHSKTMTQVGKHNKHKRVGEEGDNRGEWQQEYK